MVWAGDFLINGSSWTLEFSPQAIYGMVKGSVLNEVSKSIVRDMRTRTACEWNT